MKKLALTFCALLAVSGAAFAGTETYSGKESKEIAAPCPSWYADKEWQISVFGAFAFTSEDEEDNLNNNNDRNIIGDDNAIGGGLEAKYFFHHNLGVGLQAFGLVSNSDDARDRFGDDDDDFAGAVLATLTVRWPLECSRVAPYMWIGAGGIFSGDDDDFNGAIRFNDDDDDDAELLGQIGVGFEIRFTQHIGMINDLSWNLTDHQSWGMVRSGINFAF